MTPIYCVGEKLEERESGVHFGVVSTQIEEVVHKLQETEAASIVIAYEPVWAIGTGRTATSEQAEEMCAFIRGKVEKIYDKETADCVRIQYGGSVKPDNAAEILGMPNIDGALVGGASLLPDKFLEICK